jgi:hypothetical protein
LRLPRAVAEDASPKTGREESALRPAYFPAVCGNIDFTIFSREMSVVASMCRKIAASRKSF